MIRKSISLVVLSMLFSSCVSLAPKLDINSDEVVAKSFKNYQIAEDNSNISLNSFLIDENLKTLVNLVLENNKDIKIALLRVEESKSLYRIEESNLYPKIDANGTISATVLAIFFVPLFFVIITKLFSKGVKND